MTSPTSTPSSFAARSSTTASSTASGSYIRPEVTTERLTSSPQRPSTGAKITSPGSSARSPKSRAHGAMAATSGRASRASQSGWKTPAWLAKTMASPASVSSRRRSRAASVRRAPASAARATPAVMPASRARATSDRHRDRTSARAHIPAALVLPATATVARYDGDLGRTRRPARHTEGWCHPEPWSEPLCGERASPATASSVNEDGSAGDAPTV